MSAPPPPIAPRRPKPSPVLEKGSSETNVGRGAFTPPDFSLPVGSPPISRQLSSGALPPSGSPRALPSSPGRGSPRPAFGRTVSVEHSPKPLPPPPPSA
ncbi:MAG: hypothetical protein Q8P67_10360, partial [archaeon]|nr:hypothetical protein [archaeon]